MKVNWFSRALLLAVTAFMVFHGGAPAAGGETSYVIGVVPQMTATDTFKSWTPFAEALSTELGVTFKLKVYPTIPIFEEDVMKGGPDFVYMNPYHAVMAKREYVPLVRDKAGLIGILVASKAGDIKSISDLQGKTLVFPSPNAFAASLYMRALLSEREKIKFSEKYVKNHQNVYRSVALKIAPAGGGVQKTLEKEDTALKDQLTVLYKTPSTASHPFAADKRIPAEFRAKVGETILRMAKDPKYTNMLKNIQLPVPVQANYAQDYAPLQALGLEKFVVMGED